MSVFSMFDSPKSKVQKMVAYMEEQGLVFTTKNFSDSSPYAILQNKTSIGYRTTSKWGQTGIVFFCAKDEIDKNSLATSLGLAVYDNSTDRARPYAVFIPKEKFEKAVELLANNAGVKRMTSTPVQTTSGRKTASYQAKYRDAYYEHVKRCLARDGYSSSDSNTRTTVSDTFYLERQCSTDFMSWFVNEESLLAAKKKIAELLKAANRKNSSLELDIKYYSRDLDYFYEFINGAEPQKREKERYTVIDVVDTKKNVQIVRDNETGEKLVRKKYETFNAEVFERLKGLSIAGIPRIYEIEQFGNVLYTYEEYIEGIDLLKRVETYGVLEEAEVAIIAIQLCTILERLHAMNPPMIHRDIKPSNIILRNDKTIVLIDFNASRMVNEENNQDTILFGTQYFGAPEQLIGYRQSDQRVDVYGIGATMSYLQTMMYHTDVTAPGRLHDVWKKCTKMDPVDRYGSVVEVRNAIIESMK